MGRFVPTSPNLNLNNPRNPESKLNVERTDRGVCFGDRLFHGKCMQLWDVILGRFWDVLN